jgi:predicted AlkP superfamily pyrophosphatase or phosphodiesterase
VIDSLTLIKPDETRHVLDWPASADAGAWWSRTGTLVFDGKSSRIARIEVQSPAQLSQVQASITDVAPTAAAALSLPTPAQATGQSLDVPSADRVLLLFLDGFGYLRYTAALEQGDIPVLAVLGEPLLALTTYPPVTSVSTGSLLTGAPPALHGADRRGIRKTEAETLFDVATAAGRQVVAVEGEALAFQLRSTEWQLSGDRDGNGSTDDNVLHNTMAVLRQGMPDLLYVHFHGIDDAGHTYGPGAPEERATVREVDAAVGTILDALPGGTLVLIFADHGMHAVQEGDRLGNHGHLIAQDMLIPIFTWIK